MARLAAEEVQKNIAVLRTQLFRRIASKRSEEINEEIKESFEHAGGEHFTYIPCFNDSKEHIETLSNVISENLQGWI